MQLWRASALFYVVVFVSVRSEKDDGGPTLIEIPIKSQNANHVNCSTLEIKHKGFKTEEVLRDTIFFQPTSSTTTTSTARSKDYKYPEQDEDVEYDDTPNPENESTEKPMGNDTKSKQFTDDPNPSKNVTIHHNYSIVKKYPLVEMDKENMTECSAPFYDFGEEYYWYQILFENGGRPGQVLNVTRLTPNITEVVHPCRRPIKETVPPLQDVLYKYELIEFEKVYRREVAYLRFAGTPSEFVDVHGHFVWSPPGYGRRYYRLEYRKDDTGFYLEFHRGQKCEFVEKPLSIKCDKSPRICTCEKDGSELCSVLRSFSPALTASLVGG